MARNRIKIHPFGYKKFQSCKLNYKYSKDSRNPVQTITIVLPYNVASRDKEGKIIYHYETIDGKKKKVPTTKTYYNTFVKNVKHSNANRPFKGRTLAEMVHESYKAKAEE